VLVLDGDGSLLMIVEPSHRQCGTEICAFRGRERLLRSNGSHLIRVRTR
jgi:hypothetical protein